MNLPKPLPRLMLVTDRRRVRGGGLVHQVAEAVRGGAGIVQVREKDLADDELRDLIQRIQARVPPQTLLVVNTSLRVARTAGVGLHLPAGLPAPDRRELSLYGRSVHDEREARIAVEQNASYIVLGPIYPTESKPGHPGAGMGLVRRIRPVVHPIPIFAIGGISISTAPQVIHAGAHGVAVCGAVLSASDPRRVAEALTLALGVASRGAGAG